MKKITYTHGGQGMTFLDYCAYYWGSSSDVTGELPLYWFERYEPIADEL